jgi:orotidine-5'-phosphate decarboxylase
MRDKRSARERLIVALDCPDVPMALNLVDTLGDSVLFYKVGWRLFVQRGMDLVDELESQGKDVFLDLKMNDIGETVETAVQAIGERAMFLTVFGGTETVRAAVRGRGEKLFPKILSVTMLSSQDESDLQEILLDERPVTREDLNAYIVRRAERSIDAGCDGFIASGDSVATLRKDFPSATLVVPGIRPSSDSHDDHKRALTPGDAMRAGADFLVGGRPVRQSTDPRDAVKHILDEMDGARTAQA